MDVEFLEFCKSRYRGDSNYAVAYAILLSGNSIVPEGSALNTGRKFENRIRPADRDLGKRISSFIASADIKAFCLPQIWADCFGRPMEEYNEREARALGRAVKSLNCCEPVGSRNTERWGNQRIYEVTVRKPIEPVSDDLGI